MVAAVTINAAEGSILSAVRVASHTINVGQAYSLVAINFPSDALNLTEGSIEVAVRQTADISVAEGSILVAGKGRVANPAVRAWTFTLDGHDFYVLRLGERLTLVYDVFTDQWVDWASLNSPTWRAHCGLNWVGGQGIGYGSDVIVGDDNYGLLWFLNPTQPFDDSSDYLSSQQQIYFDRLTTGQLPMVGRQSLPCYSAWLTTDMGEPAYTGASVTLSISDDGGKTWADMGAVSVTAGQYTTPELAWYSLGQIEAPGRLFQIKDDGAVARIDSMEMNDPDDGG